MIESCSTEPRIIVCRKCGEEKPKLKGRRVCRECAKEAARDYARTVRENPEIREIHRKRVREYHKSDKGRKRRAIRDSRPQYKAKKKEWNNKHGSESWKKYRLSQKGKDRRKKRIKDGVIAASSRRQRQKPGWADYMRDYRRSEKGKACSLNNRHKRRSIEKRGTVTTAQFLSIKKSAANCAYCGVKFIPSVIRTVDHVTPLSKGGRHDMDNLVACCKPCNSKKRALSPEEWRERMGLLLL